MAGDDSTLTTFVRAILIGDTDAALQQIVAAPGLVHARATVDVLLDAISHYMYVGDSALHIAAAAYQHNIARALVDAGADVRATNRRGAEPLHYAADGAPGSHSWNPVLQAATIAFLIEAGADPNATDKSGVMPLHRAVRTRCAGAVAALISRGADPRLRNRAGSAPMDLAVHNTGRGGSGSAEAKQQQAEIIHLLEEFATHD